MDVETATTPKFTARIQYQQSKDSPLIDLGEQELTAELVEQITKQEA